MSFDPDKQQRYARQWILPGFGEPAQQRLYNASIAVVGAGGLGAPLLMYLSAAGVGAITLIDADRVALSDLHRQILYETADINSYKVEAAAQNLHDLNPLCKINPVPEMLNDDNAGDLLKSHDLILDTTDNVATRLRINQACIDTQTPMISAAVQGWGGHIYHFHGQPCYECLYPGLRDTDADVSCSASGVMGSVAGLIACWQATIAIRTLCDLSNDLKGEMLIISAEALSMRHSKIVANPHCAACCV